MSAINDVSPISCFHFNHLFDHPLCENQSLLKRIANVAFHVLTLGIPLVVYKIVSCCFPRTAPQPENENLQETAIHSVQQNKIVQENPPVQEKPVQENANVQKETIKLDPSNIPYSALGQEAFAFAKKKLADNPNIEAANLPYAQPTNPDIARLTKIYFNDCNKFDELLKQHKDKAWKNQDVLNVADGCMKLAYVISNLTLEDLKPFTEKMNLQGKTTTYIKALTGQSSYQFRTYYFCTQMYHNLRGELSWGMDQRKREGFYRPRTISKDHADLFYKIGTTQHSWNSLYNEYCDRVRLYVIEKDLERADSRHVNWTQKDTDASRENFRATPDTLPT